LISNTNTVEEKMNHGESPESLVEIVNAPCRIFSNGCWLRPSRSDNYILSERPTSNPNQKPYCHKYDIVSSTSRNMKSEKLSCANRLISADRYGGVMSITKQNSTDSSGREGTFMQHIINNADNSSGLSCRASTPIQVSKEIPIKEDPEELYLRHFYDSATWRMFYRITASRRESRTPPLHDEDDLIRAQQILRGCTSREQLKFHNIGPLDYELHDEKLLYQGEQEGIFDLEMEI